MTFQDYNNWITNSLRTFAKKQSVPVGCSYDIFHPYKSYAESTTLNPNLSEDTLNSIVKSVGVVNLMDHFKDVGKRKYLFMNELELMRLEDWYKIFTHVDSMADATFWNHLAYEYAPHYYIGRLLHAQNENSRSIHNSRLFEQKSNLSSPFYWMYYCDGVHSKLPMMPVYILVLLAKRRLEARIAGEFENNTWMEHQEDKHLHPTTQEILQRVKKIVNIKK